MAKIQVQLHGLHTELTGFACRVATDLGVRLGFVSLDPVFDVKLVDTKRCEETLLALQQATLVFFLEEQLCLDVSGLNGLVDKNPDSLVFRIGRTTETEIYESVLSGRPTGAEAVKIGSSIAAALREVTLSGVYVVDPHTGRRVASRHHRYTKGAKDEFEKGILLKPVAGWNQIEIDDLD
jgi:hypothetical protein